MITQTPDAIARHVANATRLLCEALHWHRSSNDEATDRLVASRALQAGQSARFSGQLASAWAVRCPEAWAVPEIREAMALGWTTTDRDLTSRIDDVDPGSVDPGSVAS